MAEITAKRTGELIRAVFQVLIREPEGMAASEVLKRIQAISPPTEFESSEYPNRPGVRRFEKIVRFGTIGPVKAGWLIKSKGRWTVTEEGKLAFNNFKEPEVFKRESDRLYSVWADQREPSEPVDEIQEAESAGVRGAYEEAEEESWKEIEAYFATIPPYNLQEMVAALLRAMGYYVSWVSPPGKDGGIDILAHTDLLGAQGHRIKVQVKRRGDRVTVDGLRSFMAVLGDQDVGIYVAVAGFTQDAIKEARAQEKRRITLIDLEQLFDLWVENYSKISEADREYLRLKPVYFRLPKA